MAFIVPPDDCRDGDVPDADAVPVPGEQNVAEQTGPYDQAIVPPLILIGPNAREGYFAWERQAAGFAGDVFRLQHVCIHVWRALPFSSG